MSDSRTLETVRQMYNERTTGPQIPEGGMPIVVRFYSRSKVGNYRPLNRSIQVEERDDDRPGRKLWVAFGDKLRDTGRRMRVPFGSGSVPIKERSGVDRGIFHIRLNGESLSPIHATRDDVNEHVRRLRPDDVAQLGRIDAEIERLARALRDSRTARIHFLHSAFGRGHKVQVRELAELAEKERPR